MSTTGWVVLGVVVVLVLWIIMIYNQLVAMHGSVMVFLAVVPLATGAGEAITAVLPPKTRGERADAHKMHRLVTLTAAGMDPALTVTPRQREALGT